MITERMLQKISVYCFFSFSHMKLIVICIKSRWKVEECKDKGENRKDTRSMYEKSRRMK